MMKTEPLSPRLDSRFWPHAKTQDEHAANTTRRSTFRRYSHSRSRSPPPARHKQQKPYFPNKSWVRKPSGGDASDASTVAAGSGGGTTSASSSLLTRIAPATDKAQCLLLRLTDPKPSARTSPKRKTGTSISPTRRQTTNTATEAEIFADRLIRESQAALNLVGSVAKNNGANGESSPMDLSSKADSTSSHKNTQIVISDEDTSSPTSELAVDTLLSQENGIDNSLASLSQSFKAPSADPHQVAQPPESSSTSTPSSVTSSSLDEVRQILLPIVLQNALRRDPTADQEAIKRNASDLLTDEQCVEFLRLAQETKKQLAAKERERAAPHPSVDERDSGRDQQQTPESPSGSMPPRTVFGKDETWERERDNGWPRERRQSIGQAVPSAQEGTSGNGKERERVQDSGWPRRRTHNAANSEANATIPEPPTDKGKERERDSSQIPRHDKERDRDYGRDRDRERRFDNHDTTREGGRGREREDARRRSRSPLPARRDQDRYPPHRRNEVPRSHGKWEATVKRETISPPRGYLRRSPSPMRSTGRAYSPARRPDERYTPHRDAERRRSRSPTSVLSRHTSTGLGGATRAAEHRYSSPRRGRERDRDDHRGSAELSRRSSMVTGTVDDRGRSAETHQIDATVVNDMPGTDRQASQTKRATPKMPKAMLADPTVFVVESSLATNAPLAGAAPAVGTPVSEGKSTEKDVASASTDTGFDIELGEIPETPMDVDSAQLTIPTERMVIHVETPVVADASSILPKSAEAIAIPPLPVELPPSPVTNPPTAAHSEDTETAIDKAAPMAVHDVIGQAMEEDCAPLERHGEIASPVIPEDQRVQPVKALETNSGTGEQAGAVESSINHVHKSSEPPTVNGEGQQEQAREEHLVEPARASVVPPPPPPTLVPSLWFATMGKPGSDAAMTSAEYFVDDEVAAAVQRWGQREVDFDSSVPHVKTYLLCLPAEQVAEVNAKLDPNAPRHEVVAALGSIETKWPSPGSVIVEMNMGEREHYHAWLPADLTGPLDVSPYIKPGRNTARFIQLRDISQYVFVLHATAVPEQVSKELGEQSQKRREFADYLRRTYPGSTVGGPWVN